MLEKYLQTFKNASSLRTHMNTEQSTITVKLLITLGATVLEVES